MHREDHHLASEAETLALGAYLAAQLRERYAGTAIVFLQGQLGAGKTCLVRGVLGGLGYAGTVKSPTYTLLEPYTLDGLEVFHFDLYRVNDPQELEFVGFDEVVDGPGLKLFEWAEKAAGWLPQPHVRICIEVVQTAAGFSRRAEIVFD